MMRFESMRITRSTYGPDKGKLTCVVSTNYGANTALEVVVPEQLTAEIMKVIAPIVAGRVQQALTDVQRDHEEWITNEIAKEATLVEDKVEDDA